MGLIRENTTRFVCTHCCGEVVDNIQPTDCPHCDRHWLFTTTDVDDTRSAAEVVADYRTLVEEAYVRT